MVKCWRRVIDRGVRDALHELQKLVRVEVGKKANRCRQETVRREGMVAADGSSAQQAATPQARS